MHPPCTHTARRTPCACARARIGARADSPEADARDAKSHKHTQYYTIHNINITNHKQHIIEHTNNAKKQQHIQITTDAYDARQIRQERSLSRRLLLTRGSKQTHPWFVKKGHRSGGNRLSNTTRLMQLFFKRGEECSKLG